MKKKIIYIILIVLFTCILIYSLFNIINWYKDNKHTESVIKELEDTIINVKTDNIEIEVTKQIDFNELKNKNKDTIGWIEVKNTNINYPIVQASNNSYYLNHSFDKKYTDAGWIFLDYRNTLDDKNVIIYGHARKDKSMFGTLRNTLKKDWSSDESNHTIILFLENETRYYQVFSTYHIEREDYYITTNFNNENDYINFLNNIKNRSNYDYDVNLTSEDKIITLSSCYSNTDKTVLHAKLIKTETNN